jgi:hypothetical protein
MLHVAVGFLVEGGEMQAFMQVKEDIDKFK